MKKVLACASMMLLTALSAMAAGQVQTPNCGNCGGTPSYQNYGKWQKGQGGEFTLIVLGTGPGIDLAAYTSSTSNQGVFSNGSSVSPSFQTFCIEENEYIYPGPTTSYYSISQYAIGGGNGGQVSTLLGDPISLGTAWLYSQFAHETLAYDYANTVDLLHPNGRYTDAAALQEALWYLEDEISLPTSNKYLNLLTATGSPFADLTAAKANNMGTYDVAALNLYQADANGNITRKEQTQLVMVPTPTTHKTPDSGFTFGLLGLGLAGLGVVSRRFRQI